MSNTNTTKPSEGVSTSSTEKKTVYLYNIDWKHYGVDEMEVDVSTWKRGHLEDWLKEWFIDNYNEIPLSYEIKDTWGVSVD